MNSNATADLSPAESRYKAQAEHYLAETLKILKELEADSHRAKRERKGRSGFVSEIKEILYGSR